MNKENLNVPALVALVVFVAGGIAALALGHDSIGAALIGTAVGQLGPQPFRAGK
jgi:hypothetical protein